MTRPGMAAPVPGSEKPREATREHHAAGSAGISTAGAARGDGPDPQIVTETLYALIQRQAPPFIPTEIHLITTAEGAEYAKLMLLDRDDGRFFQLCDEYGIDAGGITFEDDHITVVHRPDGTPVTDITSEEENTAVADAIVERVRSLTADEGSALHASIAGGRKTMGFYLGYALSLFGRPQDRLSHVLVSQPFESDHQFYYPPARPRRLIIKGRPVHTSEAEVMLADIPFVRMRHGIDERLRDGVVTYSEVVHSAQRALNPPELVIDLENCRVVCGGKDVPLPPVDIAFLAWFARRAKEGRPGLCRSAVNDEQKEEFLACYGALHDELSGEVERLKKALRNGLDEHYFDMRLSRLHKRLRGALGNEGARPYQITSDRARPRSRYRLDLAPEQIRFDREKLPAASAASIPRVPQCRAGDGLPTERRRKEQQDER